MKPNQSQIKILAVSALSLSFLALQLGCSHIAYSEDEIVYYKKPTPVYVASDSYYGSSHYGYDYEDKVRQWKLEQSKKELDYKYDGYDSYASMSFSGGITKCVAWDAKGHCHKKTEL